MDETSLLEIIDLVKKVPSSTAQAFEVIAGLSGSDDGLILLKKQYEKVGTMLIDTYQMPSSTPDFLTIKHHICSTLANLMAANVATNEICNVLVKDTVMRRLLKDSLTLALDEDKERELAQRTTVLLGNATSCSEEVCSALLKYNEEHPTLNILDRIFNASLEMTDRGTAFIVVVSNLTQNGDFRRWLLSKPKNGGIIRLKMLLPFATASPDSRRREAVLAAVKNCCFCAEHHEIMVDKNGVDLLPNILLVLADGSHEFTDEENAKLLVELRYLEKSKWREPEWQIRLLVVESLYQLCSTRVGREALRESGAYLILREYHRWEENVGKHQVINDRLFDVIEIIISDEHHDEQFDNYHKVEIPEDLKTKFQMEQQQVVAKSE